MKKIAVLLLTGLLGAGLLAGCGKKDDSAGDTAATEISLAEIENLTEEKEPAPSHEGEARSDLTGEWIDEELAARRPFAVMMGNTKIATPQWGISSADVIYESPVEGAETRLMPIFQDYQQVEKIGSVRSCRLYYIDWAMEFDAIYGHYGQAYLAEDMLSSDSVDNLSGLSGALENTMYFRDSSRKAPHNAYTTGEGILEGIHIKEYETQHADDYESHYKFNEDDENEIQLTDGENAVVVQPGYLVNKPWFVYNTETGLYDRFQNGSAQTDANDDSQVSVKNILMQVCDWAVADSEAGYLSVDTTSGGSGYYITNGKAVPVTWSKDSQSSPTKYFESDGNQIVMNQGKTWVCIIQDTYEDNIAFYASEDEFNAAQ